MSRKIPALMVAGAVAASVSTASAGTPTYFVPLTESAAVTEPNSDIERNAPWVTAPGLAQYNWTSMNEIESDPLQSVGRALAQSPGGDIGDVDPGRSASMWDMLAFDSTGGYVFIPHESPYAAGVSRYDIAADETQLLFQGDSQGAVGDWSNDWGAFDPSTFTPACTVLAAEEWTAEGRVMEITNPYAPLDQIQVRELNSIANVAHEGLRFNATGDVLYFVDEWNSGALYKIVFKNKKDYSQGGQTFVLSVDNFTASGGVAQDLWNEQAAGVERTGKATWLALTNKNGIPKPFLSVSPFRNGPTNDPRSNDDTRGGRVVADEVNATPYGRLEDMEVGVLDKTGNEVIYFTATSERAVYSVEELSGAKGRKAMVRLFASDADTPKNEGFDPTTAEMNSPDNLAQDAAGNIYIIEDAPNGSSTGGDIWFVRDQDGNGEAESIDHFMSLQVAGSEATGMIFNPLNPMQFVVAVQHPESVRFDPGTGENIYEDGFGDAMWAFDMRGTVEPCTEDDTPSVCGTRRNEKLKMIKDAFRSRKAKNARENFKRKCKKAARRQQIQQ